MPIDFAKVSVFCFLASYVVALGLDAARLLKRLPVARWIGLAFGLAGFAAQTGYLLIRGRQELLPPLLSSAHDWLLVLAWIVVLLYLFLTAVDRELASTQIGRESRLETFSAPRARDRSATIDGPRREA